MPESYDHMQGNLQPAHLGSQSVAPDKVGINVKTGLTDQQQYQRAINSGGTYIGPSYLSPDPSPKGLY